MKKQMYKPLEFAKDFHEFREELIKTSGISNNIFTADNLLRWSKDKNFLLPEYRGVMKPLNDFIMHNPQLSIHLFGYDDIKNNWVDYINFIANLMTWEKSKQVYQFDKDFAKELANTETIRLYPHLLKHLPYSTSYFELPNLPEFSPFDGVFVDVVVIGDEIEFYFYRTIGDIFYSWYWKTTDKIKKTDNGITYYEMSKSFFKTDLVLPVVQKLQAEIGDVKISNENYHNIVTFIMQGLTYLSSKEPDVNENPKTKKTYKPTSTIKNKFSEVRQWEVGVVYGNTIRKRKVTTEAEQEKVANGTDEDKKSRKSPRPHLRAAHWQHYWVGKGRTELILKWIEPTFVGVNGSEIPAVIHKVE